MSSGTIVKSSHNGATLILDSRLDTPVEKLLRQYQNNLVLPPKGEISTIHVDEVASKVARLYEKIRKIVDWKEENLLRRNAIERILKRNLIGEIPKFNSLFQIDLKGIAEPLIVELVRGGHLPNDVIPRSKITQVDQILEKYIYIVKNASQTNGNANLKKKVNFFNWILEIAACEIEELVAPPPKENALMEAMTVIMNERIKVLPGGIDPEEQFIQTYIAVHRTLYDLDDAVIAYHLLQYHDNNWNNPSSAHLQEITKNIFAIWEAVNHELNHPLSRSFFNLCERTDTVFTLLGDIMEQYQNDPGEIESVISDKSYFKKLITNFYEQRLATLKSRLFKLAIFSTLSVFVSNWFTFFIVEVPIASIFYEGFNPLATAVDFLVPSIAMFVLVAIIRPPSATNLDRVVELTQRLVYKGEEKDLYEIRPKKKKGVLTTFVIILLYIVGCSLSFGAIAWAFYKATIPITSVFFDTFTITLNVFAALVIRNKAREITVEEKGGFGEFILDFLSLPVAEIGSWFANKWREYNVAAVFFNVFIEIPFVIFIEFIENWRSFLNERKASIH